MRPSPATCAVTASLALTAARQAQHGSSTGQIASIPHMTPFVPLHGGHDAHGWAESSLSVAPILSSFLLLLLLLLALAGFYLWRQGKLTLGGIRSPEDEAKSILADRFARGDISSDEFLERASMLNWAPGTNPLATKRGKNRG
jgi:putative membrane protein